MQKSKKHYLILLGGSMPVITILAWYYGVSTTIIVTFIVVASLCFWAMALWRHANAGSTGNEWWQDDSCSGWRGY